MTATLSQSLASIQDGKCFWRSHNISRSKINISIGVVVALLIGTSLLLYYTSATNSFAFLPLFSINKYHSPNLDTVLKAAAMKDKTVIITPMNGAWVAPNSVFDLYLKSFRIGEQTRWLLNHLVIVGLDDKAYSRCLEVHRHCFALKGLDLNQDKEAYFLTPTYLEIVWKKLDMLRNVLQLGYNFVFSDADIMWFRNPFPLLNSSADLQISCDRYLGASAGINNAANTGFKFVRSNPGTINFYKKWHASRNKYPGKHDQDVFNVIKSDAIAQGLKMKFLDTAYFGGFCQPSKDLNYVRTMHANCCFGMDNKVHDLRIMLGDWERFVSLKPKLRKSSHVSWTVPQNCSVRGHRKRDVHN